MAPTIFTVGHSNHLAEIFFGYVTVNPQGRLPEVTGGASNVVRVPVAIP